MSSPTDGAATEGATAYGARTGGRTGRRAELRKQRRQRRRQLTAAGLVTLVGMVVVVTVVLVRSGGSDGAGKGIPARSQRTLLLQVLGADGSAVSSALLAHDPGSASGSVVLVPPQVIATVPGLGTMPFGRAVRSGGAAGSRDALADLLGVTVDGTWVIDGPSFSRLVDLENGITVDVDATVLSGRTVLLQPGPQKLDGARATAYATYLAVGEPEQTRLARLQAVLDGVVQSLPPDSAAAIGSLGAGSQTSLGATATAALLQGLAKDDGSQDLQYDSLPVVRVDAGTEEVRFRVDAAAVTSLVDRLLADSVPAGRRTQGNRVLVLNGVGAAGLGQKVRAKLVPAGFVFVGSRNAQSFGVTRSQVLVKDATQAGAALGARVATALGLPVSSVRTTEIGSVADVIVLVGSDFRP